MTSAKGVAYIVEVAKMFQELFVNACILISMVFIGSQVLIDTDLQSKIIKKFSVGIIGGILGILLMFYSSHITSTLILDFSHISEIIVAICGGLISLSITAIISVIFQFVYFGITTYSVVASLGILIVCAGCGFISKLNISKKQKWIYMLLYSVIIRSIILLLLINNVLFTVVVLMFLWIGTIVVGFTVSYLVQYLETANKALKKLRNQAEKDSLTGLNKRKNFKRLLNQVIENTTQKKEPISILIIDIDFFKKVNDVYGHLAGDSVLKTSAHILSGACSKVDILGRIRWDKFSIVLDKCSNSRALEIGERIRAVVEKYPFMLPDGKTIYITVSIGVATYPDTTMSYEEIFNQADKALHCAKHTGRNKVYSIIKDKI